MRPPLWNGDRLRDEFSAVDEAQPARTLADDEIAAGQEHRPPRNLEAADDRLGADGHRARGPVGLAALVDTGRALALIDGGAREVLAGRCKEHEQQRESHGATVGPGEARADPGGAVLLECRRRGVGGTVSMQAVAAPGPAH